MTEPNKRLRDKVARIAREQGLGPGDAERVEPGEHEVLHEQKVVRAERHDAPKSRPKERG